MPELPDVESRKKYLEETSLNQKIERIEVEDPYVLRKQDFSVLEEGLLGAEFKKVSRRGKYLILKTNRHNSLLIHLGLTGDLFYQFFEDKPPRFTRATISFDDHFLYYADQRKFGKLLFHDTDKEDEIPELTALGVEPLSPELTYEKFREIIKKHGTDIHKVLMMQEEIAGIGNVYADEICFQAGLRPDRKADELSDKEIRRLFDATKWVLKRAVDLNAELSSVADEFIIPHRRTDHTCPKDHSRLKSLRIGGRTSYFCPTDQR